jgi:hypothetical protein
VRWCDGFKAGNESRENYAKLRFIKLKGKERRYYHGRSTHPDQILLGAHKEK